jgi:hypothetical protein
MSTDPAAQLQASPARMYDYYLGGHHNFPVDREAAERVIAAFPDMPIVAQANRAFLRRAVRYLLNQGITQFLDVGSGIPTVGNVHEIAQALQPDARVMYVDIDPVAVTHSRALLANNPLAGVVQADARVPAQILNDPQVRALLDVEQPIGVLVVAMLHFVPDDELAKSIVAGLRDAMVGGSYVALTHALGETTRAVTPEGVQAGMQIYQQSTAPFCVRSREQIAGLMKGLDLVEPGLVLTPLWHPEGPDDVLLDDPPRAAALAGVGRKSG